MSNVIIKTKSKVANPKKIASSLFDIRKKWDRSAEDARLNSKKYNISELDQMFADIKNA